MITDIAFTMLGRDVAFKMDLDPAFVQDNTIAWYLQNKQLPEPEVIQLMVRTIEADSHVVDAGCNVGFFTLLMSTLAPNGRVLAVDPDPRNIHRLHKNIEINVRTNVVCFEVALSDQNGFYNFFFYEDSGSNSLRPEKEGDIGKSVKTVTLDHLWDFCPMRLLKMDIEGAEPSAMRGAEWVLKQHPDFIVCELNEKALDRFGATPYWFIRNMKHRGYDLFLLHADGAMPTLISEHTTLHITRQNTNVLFSTIEKVAEAWPTVSL